MKQTLHLLIFALLLAMLNTTSCKKDDTETSPLAEIIAEDDEATSYYDDVLAEVDELSMGNATEADKSYQSGQRQVTTTNSGDTVIHTIVYTNFVNEHSQHQRVKNGTIIIKRIGRYLSSEFWRQVTFENFTINSNAIEGVKTILKTGEYQYTVTLENARITFTNQTTYTRNATRTRTWVSGYDTPFNIWDDVYHISGSASGINRRNQAYTHTITSPLIVKLNCRWITEGILTAVVGTHNIVVDYGDGTCDNMATITINGKSYEIRLRGGAQ
jgi:hypothetical protein